MNRVSRFILVLLLGPVGVAMHALVPGVLSLATPVPAAVESSPHDTAPAVVSAHPAPQVAIRTEGEGEVQSWSERLKPQLLRWHAPGVDSRPYLVGEFDDPCSTVASAPSLQLQKVRWQI